MNSTTIQAADSQPDFATAACQMGQRMALLGTYSNGDLSIGISCEWVTAKNSRTFLAYRAVGLGAPDEYHVYYPLGGVWRLLHSKAIKGTHAAVAAVAAHWNTLSIMEGENLLRDAYALDQNAAVRMMPRVGGPLSIGYQQPTDTKYKGTKDPEVKKPEDKPCREQGGPQDWMQIFVKEFAERLGENTRFKVVYDYSGGELLLDVRLDDFRWHARVQNTCMSGRFFDSFLRSYGAFAIRRDGVK